VPVDAEALPTDTLSIDAAPADDAAPPTPPPSPMSRGDAAPMEPQHESQRR
jgi:hypothetical protein